MIRSVLIAALACGVLAGCGKKASPTPAGPPDQITYPKIYPTH